MKGIIFVITININNVDTKLYKDYINKLFQEKIGLKEQRSF